MHVVITGATSGLGKQLALDYLAQGHTVTAVGRNEQQLDSLMFKGCQVVQLDVTDKQAVIKAFNALDSIDLLILAAGTCTYMDMPEFDSSVIHKMLQVNVMGTAHCIEAALVNLIKNKSHVAMVGSASAKAPLPRAEAYGSSKAALGYLAKTLQLSLYPHGVSVSLISPGFVDTPLTKENDFPMPFLMGTAKASEIIRNGLAKKKSEIRFPIRLFAGLKLLNLLPKPVSQKLWQQLIGNKTS